MKTEVMDMTNEEFQKIVLEKLGQLDEKVDNLEQGQQAIKKDLKAVINQTADLTEFKEEINTKVDKVIDELSTIEIVTSKNWNDIAKLKSIK
jgi:uncharacterized protein (UPF0335 family)